MHYLKVTGSVEPVNEVKGALIAKDVIPNLLQVLTRIGYAPLDLEKKETISNILKPTFKVFASKEFADWVEKHPNEPVRLKQCFKRYDDLLLKIFSRDEEATRNYRRVRVLCGIDIEDEGEGKDPIVAEVQMEIEEGGGKPSTEVEEEEEKESDE
jgi:hypothetical protein